jgi:hypothetical protein
LPSSLTEGRSITLGCFSLPTCVGLRYGRTQISLEAFLGGVGARDFRTLASARCRRHASATGIFLDCTLRRHAQPVHSLGSPSLPRPLFTQTILSGAGISDLLAIAYDCNVLGLGPDSP